MLPLITLQWQTFDDLKGQLQVSDLAEIETIVKGLLPTRSNSIYTTPILTIKLADSDFSTGQASVDSATVTGIIREIMEPCAEMNWSTNLSANNNGQYTRQTQGRSAIDGDWDHPAIPLPDYAEWIELHIH